MRSLLVSQLLLASIAASEHGRPRDGRVYFRENENHIFNTINSALRQWGSSLHHNGVSFFLASVPEGTKFYHGRPDNVTVTGLEWLAYEPEHALYFTRAFGPPPPRRRHLRGRERFGQNPKDPGHDIPVQRAGFSTPHTSGPEEEHRSVNRIDHHSLQGGDLQNGWARQQQPITDNPPDDASAGGWLHTYASKRDLRLLYIDGMSAAKCNLGTIDSQDRILRNLKLDKKPGNLDSDSEKPIESQDNILGDAARGEDLCNLVQKDWNSQIDGFVRMEAGFELMLCSFKDSVDIVDKMEVPAGSRDGPSIGLSTASFLRAITSRYDDIGGRRTIVNFDKMVSAYAYPFEIPYQGGFPRLDTISDAEREVIYEDVKRLVLSGELASNTTDWQKITDMIVARYALELHYLAEEATISSLEAVQASVRAFLSPFLGSRPDRNAELNRCALQYIPDFGVNTPASRAVMQIARTLCYEVFAILDAEDVESVRRDLGQLIRELDWTVWKKCPTCTGLREVCFVPMWPLGAQEDYDTPRCKTPEQVRDSKGYWGELPFHALRSDIVDLVDDVRPADGYGQDL